MSAGGRKALAFAWRSLVRQPARAALGVLGVAAVGALLFDMLLLSNGLVTSMRDLLERMGFDVRITAGDQLPGRGPDIPDAAAAAAEIAGLATVQSVIAIRTEDAALEHEGRRTRASFMGTGGVRLRGDDGIRPEPHDEVRPKRDTAYDVPPRPWTVLRGRDIAGPRELVLNEYAGETLQVQPGGTIVVRASCSPGAEAPPAVSFLVAGIAEFPFESPATSAAATSAGSLADACGAQDAGLADFLVATSTGDPAAAAADIAALRPDLRTFTNEQAIGQLQQGGFTYFRQISAVLTSVTLTFAVLLITVLLTVSVNQRLGEVAALRAVGFSRRRVVLDVLCESALIVGIGGALSLPLGVALAAWLDGILKRMPGIPADLHFFVFEPQALGLHLALLAATAILAAAYPMRIVARLPIAATLRDEVTS